VRLCRTLLGSAALLLLLACCAPMEAPAGPQVSAPMLHEQHLVMPDGAALPARVWLPAGAPPRAVVLALHGFNEYSAFFEGIGSFLAAHDVAAYAYDQRGFGEAPNRGLWPGADALAADLGAAAAALRSRHPGTPLFVFGESMGGAVVMTAMARPDAPSVDGIVLAAPAVWGRSSMPWYQTTALWIAVHTFPWSRWSGRGFGVVASDNTEMLRALGRDPLVIKNTRIDAVYGLVDLMDRAMAAAPSLRGRMLVLYGENDQLVPAGAIAEMLQRLPPETAAERQFASYPEGWHMLTRDRQAVTVWRDVAAWIDDPRAPLPSRAAAAGKPCPGGMLCAIVPPPSRGTVASGETPGETKS
jgi:acylglycerol lipase